jgi:Zn ribbon nucleic-acid-binding protein
MWVIVDDKRIRHKWECPDCDAHANVEPWHYSEMGEPYCVDCEREMEYINTEINNG